MKREGQNSRQENRGRRKGRNGEIMRRKEQGNEIKGRMGGKT